MKGGKEKEEEEKKWSKKGNKVGEDYKEKTFFQLNLKKNYSWAGHSGTQL